MWPENAFTNLELFASPIKNINRFIFKKRNFKRFWGKIIEIPPESEYKLLKSVMPPQRFRHHLRKVD